MENFKVGDLVHIIKTNQYGIVIFFDKKREKILVRIGEAEQLYFTAEELEIKKPTN